MQIKQRSAVSTIIVMLMPSTPTKYSMLKGGGIHWARCTNWKPSTFGWKRTRSATARRSGGALNAVAVQRIRSCARDGRASTTAIPRSGMKIIRVSRGSPFVSILTSPSRCRRPRPVEEHATQHAEEHDVEVGVDRPGLHVTHAPADELGHVGDPVDGAVHHVEVEAAGEPRPAAHQRGRAVDEAVDHVEIEPGRRAAEEQRAAHEDEAVELVDPVLVEDRAVRAPAERLAEGLGAQALG